jgi:Tfp pilus assembly protein PilN
MTAAISVFINVLLKINLSSLQSEIESIKNYTPVYAMRSDRSKKQSLASRLMSGEPLWEDVFREISNIVPDSICLTRMSMNDKNIKLDGIINSNDPEKEISVFMLNLGKGVLHDVKLLSLKDLGEKLCSEFELSLAVREE